MRSFVFCFLLFACGISVNASTSSTWTIRATNYDKRLERCDNSEFDSRNWSTTTKYAMRFYCPSGWGHAPAPLHGGGDLLHKVNGSAQRLRTLKPALRIASGCLTAAASSGASCGASYSSSSASSCSRHMTTLSMWSPLQRGVGVRHVDKLTGGRCHGCHACPMTAVTLLRHGR